MNTFLLMCWEFFKTGLFAVGGGLATIPFLKEMSVKYGWFTIDKLTTMIAVSESTPGPIGINMATFVGYEMFGIPGAIAATFSLVAPSLIVICIIARMLENINDTISRDDMGKFFHIFSEIVIFYPFYFSLVFLSPKMRMQFSEIFHK